MSKGVKNYDFKFLLEALISLVFILLLLTLLNPTKILMPDNVNTMLILSMVLVFIVFAGFVWRERANDEREVMHKNTAGRYGYLSGALILTIGIVVEAFSHSIDPFLVYALCAMVIGKVVGLVVSRFNN